MNEIERRNRNSPGRPRKENAIKRTGHSFNFWLSEEDYLLLEILKAKYHGKFYISEILRMLIRKAIKE